MEKNAKSKAILKGVKEYTIIALGLLLYTIGWVVFLIPNHLVGGGVTGLSAIIYYATGFPVSYTFFLINAVLLGLALKILGRGFGAKTVFAIIVSSVFLDFLPQIIPADLINDISIENGKLLAAIIGGACSGAGIGITFTQGGSTGGTDIIALIINKYRNVSPGRIILLIDVIIIASSFIVPSDDTIGHRFAILIYGYLMIAVISYTIDVVLSGTKQSLQIFIFSKNFSEIADRITEMGRGVTVIDAKGWFTKQDGQVLMVIVRRTEINLVYKIVREIDRDAFLSVGSVMGVYGKGFDQMKK